MARGHCGARTALYMVWPADARRGDFDRVSESYAIAAKDVTGVLLPAGDLWRAAWRADAALALYGPDGFHPSPLGSYLAALAIYRGLTGRTPRVSDALRSPLDAFPPILVPGQTARMLEAIVARCVLAVNQAPRAGPSAGLSAFARSASADRRSLGEGGSPARGTRAVLTFDTLRSPSNVDG